MVSHRMELLLALISEGYDIHVLAKNTGSVEQLTQAGITFHDWYGEGRHIGFFNNVASLIQTIILFRKIKPNIIHLITVKSLLFGLIAAHLVGGIRIVLAFAGLGVLKGQTFPNQIIAFVFFSIMRTSRRKISGLIFQTAHDRDYVAARFAIDDIREEITFGSGVNLERFKRKTYKTDSISVIFASRLLLDKGVQDYLAAAKYVKDKGHNIHFYLAGELSSHRGFISQSEIEKFSEYVDYLGELPDVRPLLEKTNIFVLPTRYTEGIPKALLEAAAMGNVAITSNHPGCEAAVENNVTGFALENINAESIGKKIISLSNNRKNLLAMQHKARSLAESMFAVDSVVAKHMLIYKDI